MGGYAESGSKAYRSNSTASGAPNYIQSTTVTISGTTGKTGNSTEARSNNFTCKIWVRTA